MSSSKTDRTDAAAKKDDDLITRAAKRIDWAGSALESAADDLDDAHNDDGSRLTSLAEVVQEEAERVAHLAKDIESQRAVPDGGPPEHAG
jgi:hypothetical protein